MSTPREQLEAGIQAFESQRAALGDAVVDLIVAPLRAQLAALGVAAPPAAPPAAAAPTAAPSAPPEPTQTLRQVTILFMDVVGSTTLAQHLDPETVGLVMDGALARGTAVVEQHQGRVLQYAGDNILAAFGADTAREDDAERAVLCGLALLQLGQALGREVQAAHGHAGFNVRVGVHTGGVLLGVGLDAEATIRGSAVNLAARMEQAAPAGSLRISHDTHVQVRGMFDVQAQAPLPVQGLDAPMQSYLVLRAKPQRLRIAARGVEGVATRMIGRAAELQQLQGAFQRLQGQRLWAAVTVVADAGIGKSRLWQEFAAWCEAQPAPHRVLQGRATPQTSNQAYGLLRDIITGHLQVNDDDPLELARQKLEDGTVPLFMHPAAGVDDGGGGGVEGEGEGADPVQAQAQAHLLGHLIGLDWKASPHLRHILDDPRQIRSRALHAATQWFARVVAAAGVPVLLHLEDLHWADSESLSFLNQLAAAHTEVPLLMLAFARPLLLERCPDWGGSGTRHQRLDLLPLGSGHSHDLARELLQKLPDAAEPLLGLLTANAEGNPFYMEELLRVLIDGGAIRTGERWQLNAERLALTRLPTTLTGVLQARLDGLAAAEKRALQNASIVGAVFWGQSLAAVDERSAQQLPALVQRQLALPHADSALDGMSEFVFHHHLLHQVTYDTVLKHHKREGHARVAQWLATLAQQQTLRAGPALGIAAEHFERAGDAARAAEFHTRAAEQAAQVLAHERVLAHVGPALRLLDTPAAAAAAAPLRWRLLCAREKTLDMLARRDEQAADLQRLAGLAEQASDDHWRAEVAARCSMRALRLGDWALMESAARDAQASATRAGDDAARLRALRLLAVAQLEQGHPDACRAVALPALAQAEALGQRRMQARLLNTLSIAAETQGDLVGFLHLNWRSLLIHRETGDRLNEAVALLNQGLGSLMLGDLGAAREELEDALKMLRAHGDRVMEGGALGDLSTLLLWQGGAAQALDLARASLDIARATQSRAAQVKAGLRVGDAQQALGQFAAARDTYLQVQALAQQITSPKHLEAAAGLAAVALAQGDAAAALAALQPVLAAGLPGPADDTLQGTSHPRQIEYTAHRVLALHHDPGAAAWLARAHSALMAQAAAISDAALRQGLLQHIPVHRVIVAAWAAGGGTAAP